MREDNVDGKLSYGDFYQKMQSKYGHEGCHINKITFLDSKLKNNISGDSTHSSVVTSSEYQNKMTNDEMGDNLSGIGEAEYKVASMVDSPLGRSLWEKKNNNTDINAADVESSSSFSPISPSSSSSRSYPLHDGRNMGNIGNNADSGRTSRGAGRGPQSVWSTAIFGAQKSGTLSHNNVVLTLISTESIKLDNL